MTLLVREVARFLFESALWLGAAALIGASIGWVAARFTPMDLRRTVGWCVVGAIALAAAADRVGLPATSAPTIGSRPLPILWLTFGGVGAAGILWWTATRQARSANSG